MIISSTVLFIKVLFSFTFLGKYCGGGKIPSKTSFIKTSFVKFLFSA